MVLSLLLFMLFLKLISFCQTIFKIFLFALLFLLLQLKTNLVKLLSELLNPVIPNEHCAKDPFTFCEERQEVNANDYFLVSYNVCSLFTSTPLTETTVEIAVELISQNKPNLKISKNELKQLYTIFQIFNWYTYIFFTLVIFIIELLASQWELHSVPSL